VAPLVVHVGAERNPAAVHVGHAVHREDQQAAAAAATKDIDVGLVVNNAGSWEFGPMLEHDLGDEMRVLDVNTRAPLVLSHTFGRKLAERGRGGMIFVSSGAALQGTPNQVNYAATKAYMLHLAEGLSAELKPQGVDVLCTVPGPVRTEGAAEVDFSQQPLPPVSARSVAVDAMTQLGKKTVTAPGIVTRWAYRVQQALFSRDLNSTIAGELFGRAIGRVNGKPPEQPAQTSPQVEASGNAVALSAATSAVPGPTSLVAKLFKPITSLLGTARFARNFMGDLRKRAEEITATPGKVEDALLAKELHKPYEPPVNASNCRLEGRLYVKASMAEFFDLWSSWIEQGYGSVNDRQYADVLLKHRDAARDLPLLKYVPMTSEDTFSVDIVNGKLQTMAETTMNKFAGLLPTAKVHWLYQRTQEPRVANSFEHSVDMYNGDIQAVEAHYNRIFDPKRLNPDSTAVVKFEVREVPVLPPTKSSSREYECPASLRVHVPFEFMPFDPTALEVSNVRDHYFAESSASPWGIYLFLENIIDFALWLSDSIWPKPDLAACFALAWNITYRHELFHYHVERYAIKGEVYARRRMYLSYDQYVVMADPNHSIEEALAQNVVLRSRLISRRTVLPRSTWEPGVVRLFKSFAEPYSLFDCSDWNGPENAHALLAGRVAEGVPNAKPHPGIVVPKLEYQANDREVPGYVLAHPALISRFQLQTPKRHLTDAFLRRLPARQDGHGVGDHQVWILQNWGEAKVTVNYTHNNELDLVSMKRLATVLSMTVFELQRAIVGRNKIPPPN